MDTKPFAETVKNLVPVRGRRYSWPCSCQTSFLDFLDLSCSDQRVYECRAADGAASKNRDGAVCRDVVKVSLKLILFRSIQASKFACLFFSDAAFTGPGKALLLMISLLLIGRMGYCTAISFVDWNALQERYWKSFRVLFFPLKFFSFIHRQAETSAFFLFPKPRVLPVSIDSRRWRD